YNASSKMADLTGLLLIHSKTDGTGEQTHRMTQAKVAPGDYFVVGDTTQALRPPHVDYGYGNDLGGLRNDGGPIAPKCNAMIVDEANYTATTEGASRGFTGALAPDAVVNNMVDQWCDATMEYETGSKGSPGEANEPCKPVGQPTMCSDNGTMRDLVAP